MNVNRSCKFTFLEVSILPIVLHIYHSTLFLRNPWGIAIVNCKVHVQYSGNYYLCIMQMWHSKKIIKISTACKKWWQHIQNFLTRTFVSHFTSTALPNLHRLYLNKYGRECNARSKGRSNRNQNRELQYTNRS